MIKKVLAISSFLVASLALSGSFIERTVAGNGVLKKETRNVLDFNKINSTVAINLRVTCQKTKKIEIEGDANILALLKTDSSNKELLIRSTEAIRPKLPLNVYISVPDINSINLSGSSKVNIDNLKNNSFSVSMNGAGNLNASGQTKNVDLEVSGAGYIDTKKLKATNVKVMLSGASLVDIFATDLLDADISGFGKINYYGSPKKINKKISGMGVISERK